MRIFLLALALLLLAACQSSHVLVGAQRPPIDPSQVRVYIVPPHQFEQVAMLEASSAASGAFTRQQKTDKVISRLKAEAAALGANGVLLQGMGNEYGGSVGSANAYAYGNTAFATGMSVPIMHKAGTAIAIYVPPGAEAPPPVSQMPTQPPSQEQRLAPPPPSPVSDSRREQDPSKRCDSCQRVGRDF